jgi:hypothetical protein
MKLDNLVCDVLTSGGGTVEEHLPHYAKVKGSSPATAPGPGREQKWQMCYDLFNCQLVITWRLLVLVLKLTLVNILVECTINIFWLQKTVARHVVMRTNVEAPVKLKNSRPTQFDWQFICSIDLLYKKYSGVHFHQRTFLTHTISISVQWSVSHSVNPLFNFSLSLPLCWVPTLFSPVATSDKYSDNFMRWYHWINLIKQTQLFQLGIAHNMMIVGKWQS